MQAATNIQLMVHNIEESNLPQNVRNTQRHVPVKLGKSKPLYEAEICQIAPGVYILPAIGWWLGRQCVCQIHEGIDAAQWEMRMGRCQVDRQV